MLVKIIVILIPILITIIIIQLLLILIVRLIIINSYSKIIIIIIIPTTEIMIRSGPNWTPTITPNTHLNQAQTGHQPLHPTLVVVRPKSDTFHYTQQPSSSSS